MSATLDDALNEAMKTFDEIRADLLLADSQVGDSANRVRAWAYVRISSALEQYCKQIVRSTMSAINAAVVLGTSLRHSLFALSCDSYFASLKDVRGLKSWNRRVAILSAIEDGSLVAFPDVLPLDGRTIRPEHFETIWVVFQLPGTSLPHPSHKLALLELADIRNDLAHGEVPDRKVAGLKSAQDVLRLLLRIEEICMNFYKSMMDYLSNQRYLR
jgi:hypothetical protein